MNAKLLRIAVRRERLVTLAATQRITLKQIIDPWQITLSRVDRGLEALRYIRRHPVWIVGGGIILAVLKVGQIGRWLGRAWATWQIMRKFRGK